MENFSGVLDPPTTIKHPPKTARPRRRWGFRDKRKKCPYCLFDLTDYDPKEDEKLGYACPLCRHAILDHLLTTPLYEFTRAQQWDLLANEMEYIWKGERCDVESYRFGMGQYYNPDFTDARDRLYGMLTEKDRVLRLQEEFIEAEGELDLLIIGYLNKEKVWQGDLATPLIRGRQWRLMARRLSMTTFSERELVEFQLGLIMATPWHAFGDPGIKYDIVKYLEGILKKLSLDEGNMGA